MLSWLIPLMIVLVIAFVGVMVYNVKRTKKHVKDGKELEENVPIIRENFKRIQEELRKNGFLSSERVSSFGYNFFEYRTKYHVEDNLNVEIDNEHRLLACYSLKPYELKIRSFQELFNAELLINNGEVDTTTVTSGVGTALGGVGIGMAVSNGTSRQQVNSIIVLLSFKDGDQFAINFLNNVACYQGDDAYNTALVCAKQFLNKLQLIIQG